MAGVFVITGPSGVGKGTLIGKLSELVPDLRLSVSATTRQPREGEVDGVHYWFLSPEQFQMHVDNGEFVEHADYAGKRYGTLRSEIDRHLNAGCPVVLEIEVQGARQIRQALPEAVGVFIAPPDFDTLRTRLAGRGTDTDEIISTRLQVAKGELEAQNEFQHVVVNQDIQSAVSDLVSIVNSN